MTAAPVLEPEPGALKLSWSRLRLHGECPAKYDLQRRVKSPYTDVRNFFHGNVTDLLMRRWLSQESPEPGWMRAQVDDVFDESLQMAKDTGDGIIRWKSSTDRAETLDLCRELVVRLEPILARYVLPFEWTPALRFSVPILIRGLNGAKRQVILVGEMDLRVSNNRNQVAIWDLKATRDNAYYKKVLGQLSFYALVERAMHEKFPVVTGLIQPMCDQRVLPVAVDDDAVRQMAGRIVKTAHDIWAGRTVPKADTSPCSFCAVKFGCSRFPLQPGRVSLAVRAA